MATLNRGRTPDPEPEPPEPEPEAPAELSHTLALAVFARGSKVVRLFERTSTFRRAPANGSGAWGSGAAERAPSAPGRREFRRVESAAEYLQSLKRKAGGMHELRRVLSRVERSPVLRRLTDRDVIRTLAYALVRGSLVAYESDGSFKKAISIQRTSRVPDAAATTAAPAAAPLAPATPVLELDPLPEAVLPLLEEVQIEGARVLPEVLQTMEQIDLTMEQLSLATVSLAPAPTGVPAVGTAMTAATTDITAELAAL